MNAELNCSIVRDMLPLYAEKLTNEESNSAIKQHLEHCKDCTEYFESIQKPIDCPVAPKKEIDYMKKVKRSFRRRNYILAGVIAVIFIAVLGVFLRFFIIGSPLSWREASVNSEWIYNADSKTYSIYGNIARTKTAARIKVYEDKQNNQIKLKIYELIPSAFFSSNKFAAEIPWSGDIDIVWQGKYDQQLIMSSQYLSLFISEFKDGQYQKVVDVFDMDSVKMIERLYANAAEVPGSKLNPSFDENQHNNYIIFALPATSGVYSVWITDNEVLQEEKVDERLFLYQENGQYYFYKEGQRLKKVSSEDANKILDYIKQNKVVQ